MRGRIRCALATCAVSLLVAAPASAQLPIQLPIPVPGQGAAIQPYGTNDAGGFRNVLPPGEAGTDNAGDLAQFQANGTTRPKHWDDQEPLYENLLYASPTLTHDQIGSYFKDATFGVKSDDVESTTSPRAGVTIVRDKGYGIPHIYGTTRGDVMFGAGYVAAQDRLFLIDILRHTARAELSSFIGGSASNREMDRTQWAIAPYTEQDLQSQINQDVQLYGQAGQQAVDDVNNFVAGINEYINEAKLDPTKLPAEYAALGQLPQTWTVTDVLAEASLIGGIFGKGGGREVDSALALEALEKRFGTKNGKKAWSDFREKNDPEAPTTVKQPFPYETTSPFAKNGLALPDPGSVKPAPVAPPPQQSAKSTGEFANLGAQLKKALAGPGHASNWELVSGAHSATGHPIGVMGPQVGYYVPQILMEEDLHGPGIDARGAAFPGVNLYVELGHGRDYAWSATTATSDNVDTFAEVLCQDDFHYLYKGQCLPMDKLDRTNSWHPTLLDSTPAGSETLTAYRTVHGIVYARGTVGGKKVAFVSARTTYFHEADSALGFSQLNDPNFLTGPDAFKQAANNINFGFNWSYIDADHIAYYESGWYPQRAQNTSPDFPILGTGQYDWQGYDPSNHTETEIPFAAHPQAVDPPYLVSWNNKQAPQWAAADDQWAFGPLQRMQMIEDGVKRGIANGKKMTLEQLVSAMDEAATEDLRAVKLMPVIRKAAGKPPKHGPTRAALAMLNAWARSGGHRRDLNKDGHYDDDAAVTLMDHFWPILVNSIFRKQLGQAAFNSVTNMITVDDETIGGDPSPPAFETGWWGYVDKDLRDVFHGRHKKPRGHYSRGYCGGGGKRKCRNTVLGALHHAFDPKPNRKQMYGHGDCANDPEASCFDLNRPTVASGVSMPPFPLQNRPTFQQTIEVTRKLPR